jgi:hypothetical protein
VYDASAGDISGEDEDHESSRLQRTPRLSVDSVPDTKIEQPNDVIAITTTNICDSDLHM